MIEVCPRVVSVGKLGDVVGSIEIAADAMVRYSDRSSDREHNERSKIRHHRQQRRES